MHCAGIKVSKLSKRYSYRGLDHNIRNLFFDATGHSIGKKILLMLITVPVSKKYFYLLEQLTILLISEMVFFASVGVRANKEEIIN